MRSFCIMTSVKESFPMQRGAIEKTLAKACAEAAEEDRLENEKWEHVTLETWS